MTPKWLEMGLQGNKICRKPTSQGTQSRHIRPSHHHHTKNHRFFEASIRRNKGEPKVAAIWRKSASLSKLVAL